MRIVGLPDLLAMPAGTLFAEVGKPWVLHDVCLKGDTISDADFWQLGLAWVDAGDTGQAVDRLDEMAADSSVSYPMEWSCSRDGMFDPDRKFLVYEPADTKALIHLLIDAV